MNLLFCFFFVLLYRNGTILWSFIKVTEYSLLVALEVQMLIAIPELIRAPIRVFFFPIEMIGIIWARAMTESDSRYQTFTQVRGNLEMNHRLGPVLPMKYIFTFRR